MFVVTVLFRLVPGVCDRFLPLIAANAARSLADEPGCRQFDICTDPSRPDQVFLYEVYDSQEAFADHLTRPHFHAFEAAAQGMVAEKTVATYAQVRQ